MAITFIKKLVTWNTLLMVSVFATVFVIPALPESLGILPLRLGFTLIFFSGLLSLDNRKKSSLYIAIAAMTLQWISAAFDFELIAFTSRAINIVFFFLVVFNLVRQVAKAKDVTTKVIIESINCYLLLGIIFSIVVAAFMQADPASFSNISPSPNNILEMNQYASESMYYVFVTMGTLGYGDIAPLKPFTRSLATLILVTGQFYIAIVISLLIGKYSSDLSEKRKK